MEREASSVILANAIIWAAVVLGSAVMLRGTGYFEQLMPVLGGGAAASVVVVGDGIRRLVT